MVCFGPTYDFEVEDISHMFIHTYIDFFVKSTESKIIIVCDIERFNSLNEIRYLCSTSICSATIILNKSIVVFIDISRTN